MKKLMLTFSHIPLHSRNLTKGKIPRLDGASLTDTITWILQDGLNGTLTVDESRKYGRFFSAAIEICGVGDDEESGGYVSTVAIMNHFQELTKLYLSLCINNSKEISNLLDQQWLETLEYGDTRISIGAKHFYKTHQTGNGDVTLTQYPIFDTIQGDMFGKDWIDVSEAKGDPIYCYQETLMLVTALLKVFKLAGGNPIELEKILAELGNEGIRSVNAADSGTKEDGVNLALGILNKDQVQPKYLGIQIYSHYSTGHQAAFNPETKELEFWVVKKNEGEFIETRTMSIPSVDIPNLLKDLSILAGRSGNGPRILIRESIK